MSACCPTQVAALTRISHNHPSFQRIMDRGVDSNLLVPAQDVPDGVGPGQGLVDFHGAAAGVSEDSLHSLALKCLHENVCPLPWLPAEPILPLAAVRFRVLQLQGGVCRIPSRCELHTSEPQSGSAKLRLSAGWKLIGDDLDASYLLWRSPSARTLLYCLPHSVVCVCAYCCAAPAGVYMLQRSAASVFIKHLAHSYMTGGRNTAFVKYWVRWRCRRSAHSPAAVRIPSTAAAGGLPPVHLLYDDYR